MNKLILSSAIASVIASPAFATASYYTGTVTSGTAANSAASIVVQAGAATNVYYVNNSSSSASNKTEAAVQLVNATDWTINPTTGVFSGNIAYGSYKTQTNVTGVPTIDGRQTFVGVNQAFSGTGTWLTSTHFVFSYLNSTVNGGGGSVQTQTSSSCANGATSILGKVCTSFASASPSWEGLALDFTFNPTLFSFTGTVTGTDTSGSGLSRNTTTINWQISATDPPLPAAVPVPAAAWLFGSGLIGLAGAARRRAKSLD